MVINREDKELKNRMYLEIFGFDFEIQDIADRIIERFEDSEVDDETEALLDAMNDELIYYKDQWTIIKFYQNPENANFHEAMELFMNDLLSIIYECIERHFVSEQLTLEFEGDLQ